MCCKSETAQHSLAKVVNRVNLLSPDACCAMISGLTVTTVGKVYNVSRYRSGTHALFARIDLNVEHVYNLLHEVYDLARILLFVIFGAQLSDEEGKSPWH